MKNVILVIFIIAFLSVFVSAESCPTNPPVIYEGTISISDGSSANGETLKASLSGNIAGETKIERGRYSIDVSPCVGSSGPITFSINGQKTTTSSPTYTGTQEAWGTINNLDLSFAKIPSNPCGNGKIDIGEECDGSNLGEVSSCASYLGNNNYEGELSCTTSCKIELNECTYCQVTEETCTDWSACSGGTQTRTCNGVNTCGSEVERVATQSCTNPAPAPAASGGGGGGGGGGSSSRTVTSTPEPEENPVVPSLNPAAARLAAEAVQNDRTVTSLSEAEESTFAEPQVQVVNQEDTALETGTGITGAAIGLFTNNPVTAGGITLGILAIAGVLGYSLITGKKLPLRRKKEK